MPAAACFLLLVLSAQFELAPGAGNRLELAVYTTGLWSGRKHLFTFERYRGSVSYDEQRPERYPELEFHSTRVRAAGPDRFQVEGLLAMRGVSQPVTVTVSVAPGPVFEGSARLKMTDWGMKPPSAALGLIGTKDEMLVRFRLTAAAAPR